MSSEKPILFSAEMVRAILDDRKTQTRRIIKLAAQLAPNYQRSCMRWNSKDQWWEFRGLLRNWPLRQGRPKESYWETFVPPIPYPVGARLWVRETWCKYGNGYIYRADYPTQFTPISDGIGGPWKPSIHMPRAASRITLEVTDVRVQRLQEISEEDAIAEGVEFQDDHKDVWRGYKSADGSCLFDTARRAFQDLWESINGPDSWIANPWVWVYEFRRVKP